MGIGIISRFCSSSHKKYVRDSKVTFGGYWNLRAMNWKKMFRVGPDQGRSVASAAVRLLSKPLSFCPSCPSFLSLDPIINHLFSISISTSTLTLTSSFSSLISYLPSFLPSLPPFDHDCYSPVDSSLLRLFQSLPSLASPSVRLSFLSSFPHLRQPRACFQLEDFTVLGLEPRRSPICHDGPTLMFARPCSMHSRSLVTTAHA